MNHWETPELTPDVDFFLLSRYKCTTETMRILSLVCGNSTRRGLHGPTTRFRKLPWTYSVIHYLFGAKHERVFKHMNDRFWESDSFLKHKVQQCWSFQFLLVLHFFFFFCLFRCHFLQAVLWHSEYNGKQFSNTYPRPLLSYLFDDVVKGLTNPSS